MAFRSGTNYTVKDNSHILLLVVYVVEGLTSVKQIDGRIRGWNDQGFNFSARSFERVLF